MPPLQFHRDLPLVLEEGALDSLDLIDLVLGVEARASQILGRRVVLVGTGNFNPEDNPFATVGALVDRLDEILAGSAP